MPGPSRLGHGFDGPRPNRLTEGCAGDGAGARQGTSGLLGRGDVGNSCAARPGTGPVAAVASTPRPSSGRTTPTCGKDGRVGEAMRRTMGARGGDCGSRHNRHSPGRTGAPYHERRSHCRAQPTRSGRTSRSNEGVRNLGQKLSRVRVPPHEGERAEATAVAAISPPPCSRTATLVRARRPGRPCPSWWHPRLVHDRPHDRPARNDGGTRVADYSAALGSLTTRSGVLARAASRGFLARALGSPNSTRDCVAVRSRLPSSPATYRRNIPLSDRPFEKSPPPPLPCREPRRPGSPRRGTW